MRRVFVRKRRRLSHDAVNAKRTLLGLGLGPLLVFWSFVDLNIESLILEIWRGHHDAIRNWQISNRISLGWHRPRNAVRSPICSITQSWLVVEHQVVFGELGLVPLESFSSAQKAAVVKHVLGRRVQGPVVPFPRVSRFSRDLDEAVVE